VGRINVTFDAPQFGELELLHADLSPGGSWTPQSCTARHRVAVIIPFRDRQLHLRTLLSVLHPMLQRQMLHYTIFVVEQVRFTDVCSAYKTSSLKNPIKLSPVLCPRNSGTVFAN